MKKIFTLFFALILVVFSVNGAENGTLTSNPNPILPSSSVVIDYDGSGTNFATWQPQCFIHTWLVNKVGTTFTGNYAPTWITCNGDADYLLIDAKYKMSYSGTAGKYSITIPNLYTFFSVLEEDKAKIDKFGVIVRAQFSGGNNQTVDFLLNVTNPQTNLIQTKQNLIIASGKEVISAKFDGNAKIQLFTMTGQLIRSVVINNEFTQTVNSGVYLLRINGETHKVIVQ